MQTDGSPSDSAAQQDGFCVKSSRWMQKYRWDLHQSQTNKALVHADCFHVFSPPFSTYWQIKPQKKAKTLDCYFKSYLLKLVSLNLGGKKTTHKRGHQGQEKDGLGGLKASCIISACFVLCFGL